MWAEFWFHDLWLIPRKVLEEMHVGTFTYVVSVDCNIRSGNIWLHGSLPKRWIAFFSDEYQFVFIKDFSERLLYFQHPNTLRSAGPPLFSEYESREPRLELEAPVRFCWNPRISVFVLAIEKYVFPSLSLQKSGLCGSGSLSGSEPRGYLWKNVYFLHVKNMSL